MALDRLLENEARSEIERINSEAKGQAEKIISEARENAQNILDSKKRSLESQRQAGLVRARSAADLEANASRLSANEEGMSQVYSLVDQYLGGISNAPEYRDILSRLIAQARQALPDAEAVEVNPNDVGLGRILVQDLPVRENPSISGGVRVIARGGKSGITNTLAGRLARVKEELAPLVSRTLAE